MGNKSAGGPGTMATLLETDIAHLSENIAQQYAIPAQYF